MRRFVKDGFDTILQCEKFKKVVRKKDEKVIKNLTEQEKKNKKITNNQQPQKQTNNTPTKINLLNTLQQIKPSNNTPQRIKQSNNTQIPVKIKKFLQRQPKKTLTNGLSIREKRKEKAELKRIMATNNPNYNSKGKTYEQILKDYKKLREKSTNTNTNTNIMSGLNPRLFNKKSTQNSTNV